MLQTVRLLLALICVLLTLQIRIAAKPSTPESETKGDRPISARSAAPKRTARELQAEVDQALMEERLNHRDTEPWPKETDEDHAAALKDFRKVVDEVARQYPRGKVYETKYFICFSNIPETQIRPYVDALDHMYEYMCQLYEISLDRKVWRGGKAPVFAFLEEKQLESFEKKYFPHIRKMLGKNLGNVAALCHRAISGEVVISCWRGDDPALFGHSLVHETSHGFNHRYKTKRFLPNWVDEGLAEIVGAEMLPACTVVSRREAVARSAECSRPSELRATSTVWRAT
jgi:hypothetical protein